MFAYNTSVHEATKFTPFEVVFGKIARTLSSFPDRGKIRNLWDLSAGINIEIIGNKINSN